MTPRVDREAAARAVLEDLDLLGGSWSFVAAAGLVGDERSLARAAWDLDAVEQRYEDFLELVGRRPRTDRQALVAQVRRVQEWRRFPLLDPGLPHELLPPRWSGHRAADVFRDRHAAWAPRAGAAWAQLIHRGWSTGADRRAPPRPFRPSCPTCPVISGAPRSQTSTTGGPCAHRQVEVEMPAVVRTRVQSRVARPRDLPAVLALVRQHRAEAHAEGVLSGQTPGAAAEGFRALLADPGHRVVLAVLPAGSARSGGPSGGEQAVGRVAGRVVGMAVLGVDRLSVVLGTPQVTVDNLVVAPQHRRRGVGAVLLAAAALYAEEVGAHHLVATVGGHEAERQRFLARMGFAPLTTRRIVPRELLVRSLNAWQANRLLPAPRRAVLRRPQVVRRPAPVQPTVPLGDVLAAEILRSRVADKEC